MIWWLMVIFSLCLLEHALSAFNRKKGGYANAFFCYVSDSHKVDGNFAGRFTMAEAMSAGRGSFLCGMRASGPCVVAYSAILASQTLMAKVRGIVSIPSRLCARLTPRSTCIALFG